MRSLLLLSSFIGSLNVAHANEPCTIGNYAFNVGRESDVGSIWGGKIRVRFDEVVSDTSSLRRIVISSNVRGLAGTKTWEMPRHKQGLFRSALDTQVCPGSETKVECSYDFENQYIQCEAHVY